MTISSLETRVDYVGDGTSTEFAVPFQFFLPSDLTVIRRDSTTGAETVLTLATDYSVTGGNNATGTVTLATAAVSGTSLVILRDTLRVQETDYVDYDAFPAEAHEDALDRLTMQTQELSRELGRRLALRRTDPIEQALLPTKETRANRLLGFDGDGAPVAVALSGDGTAILETDSIIGTVNGYLNALFPVGMIVIWSGASASIPAGWALCNGSNGTPDLRDRFVVGAGTTYAVGATGGAALGTTSAAGAHSHGGTTGSTALTVDQIPPHTHGIQILSVGPAGAAGGTAVGNGAANSGSTGGGLAHNHTISTQAAHTHTVATLPPYYALCYIMRTGAYLPGTGSGSGWNVVEVSDTTHTPTTAVQRAYYRMTANSTSTITIPTNATQPFAVGTEIIYEQAGVGLDGGLLSFVGASGVTLNSLRGNTSEEQFAVVRLVKVATDEWTLHEDLVA